MIPMIKELKLIYICLYFYDIYDLILNKIRQEFFSNISIYYYGLRLNV